MKRYLITGALMLVAGILITSCHDQDIEVVNTIQLRNSNYDEAFKEYYGNIDPNHNWGFKVTETSASASTRAATRTANKNSNQWASQGYTNIPDPLTSAQKDKVRRYFQQNRNPQGVAVNYSNFFVQQVYKGASNTENSLTTEKYEAGNGGTVTGSNQMDKLTAGLSEDHINDFNNGNRGEINVQNNDKSGEHMDAITLMENSSTECFGFHNSLDSKQYNDHYVIIPGQKIQEWDPSTTDANGVNSDVTGMFFVGFDYEANKNYDLQPDNTNMYLVKPTTDSDPNGVNVKDRQGKYLIGGADGYYSDWIVRITKGMKKTNVSGGGGEQKQDITTVGDTYKLTKWTLLDKGRVFCEDLGSTLNGKPIKEDLDFNDVVFDALVWKKEVSYWQEVAVQATDDDGNPLYEQKQVYNESNQPLYYQSDGSKGTTVTEDPVTEDDLDNPVYETNADGSLKFESEKIETEAATETTEYKADICILAAGATLPLSVAGIEVHNAFGINVAGMVNTVGSSSTAYGYYLEKDPIFLKNFTQDKDLVSIVPGSAGYEASIRDIPIQVQWNQNSATTLSSGDITTDASGKKTMSAPHKFMAEMGTPWAQERFNIEKGFPKFPEWVGNASTNWTSEQNALYLYEQNWTNLLAHSTESIGYNYEDKEIIDPEDIGLEKPSTPSTPSTPSNPSVDGSNVVLTYAGSIEDGYQNKIIIPKSSISGAKKGSQLIISATGTGGWININLNDGYVVGMQGYEWTGSYTYTFGDNAQSMISNTYNGVQGIKVSGNSLTNLSITFVE